MFTYCKTNHYKRKNPHSKYNAITPILQNIWCRVQINQHNKNTTAWQAIVDKMHLSFSNQSYIHALFNRGKNQ